MDPSAARQRLETYLDLFLHPGWKQLQAELEEYRAALVEIDTIGSLEDLHQRKGQMHFVRYLATLEDAIRRELDNWEQEPLHYEEDF